MRRPGSIWKRILMRMVAEGAVKMKMKIRREM